jgi:hypothetical protein
MRMMSHPCDDSSAAYLRHCDPYDPLLSKTSYNLSRLRLRHYVILALGHVFRQKPLNLFLRSISSVLRNIIRTTMAGKLERVRSAALSRDTNETKIQLAINLDGGAFPPETDSRLITGTNGHATQSSKSQTIAINSGIGFLDHMLHALAKHAGWSLALNCKGDLHSTYREQVSS